MLLPLDAFAFKLTIGCTLIVEPLDDFAVTSLTKSESALIELPLDEIASRFSAKPSSVIELPLLDLHCILSDFNFILIIAALEVLIDIFSLFKVFELLMVAALEADNSSIIGIFTITFFDPIFKKEL